MPTYRLKKGYGSHVCSDGHEITQENPVYETEDRLSEKIPDKFDMITGHTVVESHPFGTVVTGSFALASEIPQCVVWKNGRRYRITINGNLQDTDPNRITSEEDVDANLKKIVRSIERAEMNDAEMDDEEEEPEPDEDEDDEDDEPVLVVAKKKKIRKTK